MEETGNEGRVVEHCMGWDGRMAGWVARGWMGRLDGGDSWL